MVYWRVQYGAFENFYARQTTSWCSDEADRGPAVNENRAGHGEPSGNPFAFFRKPGTPQSTCVKARRLTFCVYESHLGRLRGIEREGCWLIQEWKMFFLFSLFSHIIGRLATVLLLPNGGYANIFGE